MKNPVVSVIVVSYNAATTILETLVSIKNQTYKNIELIISDDCSCDETVSIAREWLDNNFHRFVNVKLLTASKNQGVCVNCNKGRNAASGEWIKGIAADDILFSNCIEDYVNYVNNNLDAQFVTSYMRTYRNIISELSVISKYKAYNDLSVFERSSKDQLKIMAFNMFVYAPTIFYSKDLFINVGGYNEKYAYEDHPFYISVLEHGYKIHFMPIETVGYRKHESLCNSNSRLFNYQFMLSVREFRKKECFKYYNWRQKLSLRLKWKMEDIFEKMRMNKKTKVCIFMYSKSMAFFNLIAK